MNAPRRSDMPVLEFIADALFGIGCMIVGLGGLCTLATCSFAGQNRSTTETWAPAVGMLVVGSAVMLLGRALRRWVRGRVRKVDHE